MNTTLEKLPEMVKENRFRQLGENIVKYQYFKTSEIIRLIDNAGYSEATLRSFIDNGIGYLSSKVAPKNIGRLPIYIDEAVNKHIQPLTPKQEQKRRIGYHRKPVIKKGVELPINKVLKEITKNEPITDKIETLYAVKMDKNIRLQNSLIEAQAFLEGLTFLGKSDAKVIEISYKEL